jgi:hypothetical protein
MVLIMSDLQGQSGRDPRLQQMLKFLGFGLNLSAARNEYRALLRSQGFAEADIEANVAFLRTRFRVRLFAVGITLAIAGAALRELSSGAASTAGVVLMYVGLLAILIQVLDKFNPGPVSVRQMIDVVRGRRRQ